MLRFNFLEKEESLIEKVLKPDIVLALLIAFLVSGGLFWYVGQLKNRETILKRESLKLDRELARLKKVQSDEKKLLQERTRLKKKMEIISELDNKRKVSQFVYFFADRRNIPSEVWLKGLKQDGNKVFIEGEAYNLKIISQFLKNIEENLGNVTFKDTVYEEYTSKSTGKTYKYYKFRFNVEMK